MDNFLRKVAVIDGTTIYARDNGILHLVQGRKPEEQRTITSIEHLELMARSVRQHHERRFKEAP